MQKLLLFLFALVAVWYVRRWVQRRDAAEQTPTRPAPMRDDAEPSEMVRECGHCGVLVPESEGVVLGGEFYCSAEHARLTGRGP